MKITKTHDGKIVIDGESNILIVTPPDTHSIIVHNMEPGEDIYVRNFFITYKNKRYSLKNKIKFG
jgi:hypothetical protein